MFLSKHFGFSFYLIIKQCIFIFADFLLLLICCSMNMSVLPEPLMSSVAMLHGGVRGILGKCRCRFLSTAEGHEEEDEWGRWAVHLTFGRFRWKSENAAFINKPGGVIPRVSWKNVKWFPVMVLLVHSTYFTYFVSSIEPIHYIDLISYTQLTVCSVKLSGSSFYCRSLTICIFLKNLTADYGKIALYRILFFC